MVKFGHCARLVGKRSGGPGDCREQWPCPREVAGSRLCPGRPASTRLPLLAQACNNLIDLDADVLISAACLVYAELIQKDVSGPDYLSSSSKKPPWIFQAQLRHMAGYLASETGFVPRSLPQPMGAARHGGLAVCICNSRLRRETVLPNDGALIPLLPASIPAGRAQGWAPRGSVEYHRLDRLKNESNRTTSVHLNLPEPSSFPGSSAIKGLLSLRTLAMDRCPRRTGRRWFLSREVRRGVG